MVDCCYARKKAVICVYVCMRVFVSVSFCVCVCVCVWLRLYLWKKGTYRELTCVVNAFNKISSPLPHLALPLTLQQLLLLALCH